MLKDQFEYYLSNQNELVKLYAGKVLIITGQKVVGAYDSYDDADNAALEQFGEGTYLLQKCSQGTMDYRVHSLSSWR